MSGAGARGTAAAAVALALVGCSSAPPAPTETVTVTVAATTAPRPAETVTVTESVTPSVHVPAGGYAILLGDGATPDDAALATAFVDFALDPSTQPVGLTFAPDGVQLGILQRIFATRAPGELGDPSAWLVGDEDDLYFEASGPFSAIDPVRRWVLERDPEAEFPLKTGVFSVAVGEHEGCPYEIDGVPPGMEAARQVWLTPVGENISCAAGWFAVDLFVVDDEVAAVTVALGSP